MSTLTRIGDTQSRTAFETGVASAPPQALFRPRLVIRFAPGFAH